jgi:UDP-N-acetylglucosamine 2-epimerase (non-hydrolysing)
MPPRTRTFCHRPSSGKFWPPIGGGVSSPSGRGAVASPLHFIYPVHPNPNVKGPAHHIFGGSTEHLFNRTVGLWPLHLFIKTLPLCCDRFRRHSRRGPQSGKTGVGSPPGDGTARSRSRGHRASGGNRGETVKNGSRPSWTTEISVGEMGRAVNPYGDGKAAQSEPWPPFDIG